MTFAASKILWALLQPGNLFLALLTVCSGLLLVGGRRMRRLGKALLLLCVAAGLAIATMPLGDWLMRPLEDRFPRPELPDRVDGIIVLGGMVDQVTAAVRGEPTLNDAAERLVAFRALAQRYPGARLVATGGSGRLDEQSLKETPVMAEALRQMGLDPATVLFESESRNTHENAVLTRAVVSPREGETWLLVTSALHMPRSVGVFRAQGWAVVPWPVDYRSRPGRTGLRFDFGDGLETLETALHEWTGLLAYWLMGRTSALFPAPTPDPQSAL